MARRKRGRVENGRVSIRNRGSALQLRWTHQGKRYSLALGMADTPLNRRIAEGKKSEIEADIAYGRFDESLARYRPEQGSPHRPPTPAELFDQFVSYRRSKGTKGQTIASKYAALRSNLVRFKADIATEGDALRFMDLLRLRQQANTANQNLSLLKAFYDWAVEQQLLPINPFASLRPQRVVHEPNPKRQPLTREQTRTILTAFKFHPVYHCYHDYVFSLTYLGARPSEVSGLRWKDIDWSSKRVLIASSLSRSEDGNAAGYARQRKATKNNKARWLDLHPDLVSVLQGRMAIDAQPDDLIFLAQKGGPIDDHDFSQRPWKAICEQVGIDRTPYALRHSLGSHLLESGYSVAQVAQVLGNTPETVTRYYAHVINRPEMPGFLD